MKRKRLLVGFLLGGTIAFGIMKPDTGLAEPHHHSPTGVYFNNEVINRKADSRFFGNGWHGEHHNEPYGASDYENFRGNRESESGFYPNRMPHHNHPHHNRVNW